MPDFSRLMKAPAGESKRPPPLPIMTAPGIIKSFEAIDFKDDPSKDYDTVIRLHLVLTGWPESIPESERVEETTPGNVRPIDLSRRRLRRDFYDNAMYRLDELLRDCKIEPLGRTYEEVLPELVGCRVNIEVQRYLNQRTSEIGNQVGSITGAD